ncbi:MAG: iron ABC transporter permease [Shinella sp.]|nr:iron ABC transporter permease [Shinella sp.]
MSLAAPLLRQAQRTPSWLLIGTLVPSVLVAVPLFYVAVRSFEAGLTGIASEIFRERTFDLLVNTLTLAACVTTAAAAIGTAFAWCVERTDLPMRRAWRVLASLPLAVPAFVASFAWSSFHAGFESMAGAIFILSLASYPLVYLPVAAALRSMEPAFEDVSRSLGKGRWETFFRVILPQAGPALGAGALLVLTHMFAEFGALSLLRVQTFTTAIFASYELQFDSATAALQAAVLVLLCLPAAYGEMRLRRKIGVARVGRGSARRMAPVRLGRWRLPVFLCFCLSFALSLGVPLLILVYWLTVGFSAGRGHSDILPAIGGSLSLAVPGAFVVVLLALSPVLLSVRHEGPLSRAADRLPYIVHGLPGLVVALALVFVSIHYLRAFYQTVGLLMAAYAILFLPQAQSALRASIELVPARLEEAARSLGRRPLAAFMSVTVPNILPGIGAALALIALELMRELTSTLMLAPIGVATLATEVWTHTNDGEYAAAAPFAALLVAVSALPVYFFTRRSIGIEDIQ